MGTDGQERVATDSLTEKCPHCDADRSGIVCPGCGYRSPLLELTDNSNGGGNIAAFYVFIDRHLIPVAKYLGVAAAGGVIGNRVDSTLLIGARHLFQSVHDRWHKRATEKPGALTEDEAIDAAKAAAATRGYELSELEVISKEQSPSGEWTVELRCQCRGALIAISSCMHPCRKEIRVRRRSSSSAWIA